MDSTFRCYGLKWVSGVRSTSQCVENFKNWAQPLGISMALMVRCSVTSGGSKRLQVAGRPGNVGLCLVCQFLPRLQILLKLSKSYFLHPLEIAWMWTLAKIMYVEILSSGKSQKKISFPLPFPEQVEFCQCSALTSEPKNNIFLCLFCPGWLLFALLTTWKVMRLDSFCFLFYSVVCQNAMYL